MNSLRNLALCLLLLGAAGCQCCALTEHYASAIDCISDHEHHFERVYCPGLDLNRIGRPDWCADWHNYLLCPCVCDRCRPAPCGYVVCRETIVPDRMSPATWAGEHPPEPAANAVDNAELVPDPQAKTPPAPAVAPALLLPPPPALPTIPAEPLTPNAAPPVAPDAAARDN